MKNEMTPSYHPAPLIKGCWQFSPGHGASRIESNTIEELFSFADSGITTFDCADIYAGTEELLGTFRKEYAARRGEDAANTIHVHTKFVPDLNELPRINKTYVERIINRSLTRLQANTLDLVQFHWWDYSIPGMVETAKMLAELQKEGKIKHIGVTNCDVEHLKAIIDSGIQVVTNQVQYSLLDNRPEHGMSEYCAKHNIGLLCYGSVAGGFLSERYLGVKQPTGELENRSLIKYQLIIEDVGGWDAYQGLLVTLSNLAKKHHVSMSTIALRFVLNCPQVYSVISGASARHIGDLKAVQSLVLDIQDMQIIKESISLLKGLEGDLYQLEREIEGKHAKIMRYNLNN
jgi:aryl-alcohol dehydrogenase-like predicted oxidoreductase